MAASVLKIDTKALERDTGQMRFTLRRIDEELEGMYDAVRALNAMWDGPANQAFRLQFRSDYENMMSICETVRDLIRCMENAGRRYQAGGAQVESAVEQIPV